MNARLTFVLAACVMLVGVVGSVHGQIDPAEAGACYATTGGEGEALLIKLDLATGLGTSVGGGTGIGEGVPALAIDSQGRIFAVSRDFDLPPKLYQIDGTSGEARDSVELVDTFGGIDFNSADFLYGVDPFGDLSLINLDGSAVYQSSFVGNLAGLSFDDSDILYATSGRAEFGGIGSDDIGTVDIGTGNELVLGSLGTGTSGTPDLAFDYEGNLYVAKGGGSGTGGGGSGHDFQLYSVDQSTWVATALPNSIGYGASGLACDPRTPDGGGEEDEKVFVCHSGKTLHVGIDALLAHVNHGDSEGACQGGENGPGQGRKGGKADAAVPESFSISQNYPNPFNPTTTISFALPEAASVRLAVYNAMGQEVTVLVSSTLEAGTHSATWNATDHRGQRVSTGLYIYRLTAGDHVETRKMLLLE